VLVSDGSSLTARQAIDALGRRSGVEIEVVDSGGLPLAHFSRFVSRVHRVPPYGTEPLRWLDATAGVLERGGHDVLFAAHEQTAVLAHAVDRVRATGAGLCVPPFASLACLQDKHLAAQTLERVGLHQPRTRLAASADEVRRLTDGPVYVKARVATASAGVFLARDGAELAAALGKLTGHGAFDHGGVLLQDPASGPLVMVQSAFDRGTLVAHHAVRRRREGADGSSSHKQSVVVPEIARDLARLGRRLGWHGALSLDAILTPDGPCYIDVNPRLVEPGNAQLAGVDLVGTLLELARGRAVAPSPSGRAGTRTHQLLPALLGAAQQGRGRGGVVAEVLAAGLHQGSYVGSAEELTPIGRDPLAAVPVAAVTIALIAWPRLHSAFASGATRNYALTATGWEEIVAAHEAAAGGSQVSSRATTGSPRDATHPA
jgi:hypothetical protein